VIFDFRRLPRFDQDRAPALDYQGGDGIVSRTRLQMCCA
jgi:hypothetical protein